VCMHMRGAVTLELRSTLGLGLAAPRLKQTCTTLLLSRDLLRCYARSRAAHDQSHGGMRSGLQQEQR
jgi:hypothetical protein